MGVGSGDWWTGYFWRGTLDIGQNAVRDDRQHQELHNALEERDNYYNKALELVDEASIRGAEIRARKHQISFLLQKLELSGANMDQLYQALDVIFDHEYDECVALWEERKRARAAGEPEPPEKTAPSLPIK